MKNNTRSRAHGPLRFIRQRQRDADRGRDAGPHAEILEFVKPELAKQGSI